MIWRETLTKVGRAVGEEIEIFVLLGVFLFWYLSNIDGFLSFDMGIIAVASYALVTGRHMYLDAVHPPLAQYFNGFGQLIFGETLFGAKFPSLLFATLTIYLTYKIGRKMGNRYTGFFAALLLGMTKLYSKYVVQVTYDIILTFFVVLLFYVALLYIEHHDIDKKKRNLFALIVGVLFACVVTSKIQGALYGIFVFAFVLFKGLSSEKISEVSNGSKVNKMWEMMKRTPTTMKYSLKNSQVRCPLFGFLLAFLIIYSPYLRFDYIGISSELAWRNVPDHPFVKYLPHLPAIFYVFGFAYWGITRKIAGTSYQFWAPSYWIFEYGGLTFVVGLSIALIYATYLRMGRKENTQNLSFLIACTAMPFLLVSIMLPSSPRYLIPLLPFFSVLITTSVFGCIKLMLNNRRHASKIALIGMVVLLLLPSSPVISTLGTPRLAEDSAYSDAARYLIDYAKDNQGERIVAVTPRIINYYVTDKPANLCVEELPYPLAYTGYSENYSKSLYHRIKESEVDLVIMREPLRGEFGYYINQQIHEYITTHAESVVVLESVSEGAIYIYHL